MKQIHQDMLQGAAGQFTGGIQPHDLAHRAVVFVFMVLPFEFKSSSAPVPILSAAALAISGSLIELVAGISFNISTFMGVIMVAGLVAKNGILLLDADKKFRHAGLSPLEPIPQAERRRLRPILMTALAAAAGTLALEIGTGSQMLPPLAIALIGGLLFATVLSLMVTPAVYYYLTLKTA